MLSKRKLKDEVVRLSYRVKELEERICPCEQHEWVVTRKEFASITSISFDVETIYHCKCKNCGKETKKRKWEFERQGKTD